MIYYNSITAPITVDDYLLSTIIQLYHHLNYPNWTLFVITKIQIHS